MKISVIGTGAYSIGIALMLAKNEENKIMLWSENQDYVKEFKETHKISKIFENVVLPNNIDITNSFEEVMMNTSLIFFITSAKYLLSVCESILPYYKNTPVCIASKGIEQDTCLFLYDLIR